MQKSLPASLLKGRSQNKKRVVVAMSGGVDSSVAAALLKKQGYDVVGVFMRFWAETQATSDWPLATSVKNTNTCCSDGAEQAARDVATKLGIPFYVLSVQKEFKKAVVDYFLTEERKGRTPNPCVVCNKKIKFGLLFEKAISLGADYIATGHYARVSEIKNQKSKIKNVGQNSKVLKLHNAKDEGKDQSYFLYNLTQAKLARILFPLGDYLKSEVYALAKKWRLPYRKDESFDLCFVPDGRENFLLRHLKMKEGMIINLTHPSPDTLSSSLRAGSPLFKKVREMERALGKHRGLALYTIGQRKNIPVGRGPWWVVKKDEKRDILYVSNNEKDLYSRELVATGVNWLNGKPPKLPAKVLAKIRYKSEGAEALIVKSSKFKIKSLRVIFKNPQRAVTPGQSIVFYAKDGELLGGGAIS